jgi:hypothetical protein
MSSSELTIDGVQSTHDVPAAAGCLASRSCVPELAVGVQWWTREVDGCNTADHPMQCGCWEKWLLTARVGCCRLASCCHITRGPTF